MANRVTCLYKTESIMRDNGMHQTLSGKRQDVKRQIDGEIGDYFSHEEDLDTIKGRGGLSALALFLVFLQPAQHKLS